MYTLYDASTAKTIENIVIKGVIAQNEQFLHLPKCFQLFSVIVLSFIESLNMFG